MSLRVTYPNEGLYEGGKPRLEQFDDRTGQITYCREATVGEAAIFANTTAVNELRATVVNYGELAFQLWRDR